MSKKIYMIWSEEKQESEGKGWYYLMNDKTFDELIKEYPEGYVKYSVEFEDNTIIDTDYSTEHLGKDFFKTIGIYALVNYYCETWDYKINFHGNIGLDNESPIQVYDNQLGFEEEYKNVGNLLEHIRTTLEMIVNSNNHAESFKSESQFYLDILNNKSIE